MSRQHIEDATIDEEPGSSVSIYYSLTSEACSNSCNGTCTYILLHEDHRTGVLKEISRQQNRRFQISEIQLNISGVYCVYEQNASEVCREQCCIRIRG